eukprot:14522255-Heterocapsa_arctica.AAC.1
MRASTVRAAASRAGTSASRSGRGRRIHASRSGDRGITSPPQVLPWPAASKWSPSCSSLAFLLCEACVARSWVLRVAFRPWIVAQLESAPIQAS